MLVRAEQACFIGGFRRKAGAEFEYNGNPAAFLTVIGESAETIPDVDSVLSDEQLRVRLAEYGVKIPPKTGRAEMINLLSAAEGKAVA